MFSGTFLIFMVVLTLTFIKTKWLKLIWFRHSNCMSHVSKLLQPFTEVWSLICICLCQASLIHAWEETFLMVALTKTFLCVPLHLWFIPATAMYLWLSFPLFFCLSQWLDERSQKERSVLTGGDRSNSQLPIVFLKQESSWRKIWIRFWLAGQTCEHIDISLKYMQVIQALLIPCGKPYGSEIWMPNWHWVLHYSSMWVLFFQRLRKTHV